MPSYPFDILTLISELENDTYLAEALLFPELSRLESSPEKTVNNLRNSLPDLLDGLPTVELHRRRVPQGAEARTVQLELAPPERSVYWSQPVVLTFHAACWQQRGTFHGFVPTLTIEVMADSAEELDQELQRNIAQELQRRDIASKLDGLIWLQRVKSLTVQASDVELDVKTARKRAEALSQSGPSPSVLKEVATNLNQQALPQAFEVDQPLRRLADILVGSHGKSVLLVGPSGVGKTALARELVRQRRHYHLSAVTFWETTGARLMVGADSFGDWQERCRKVVAQASAERSVLLLGNLFELAEVARHATTPQGVAGFFRPYIERGDLLCIVECTPQQRDLLERDHPHLLQAFSVLQVEVPTAEQCRTILGASVPYGRFSEAAISTAESLHRRYAGYSAYPGRPLHFLHELSNQSQQTSVADQGGPSEIAAAFAAESGLPRFIVDDSLPLDLEAAKRLFAEQILGQDEAVALVVDLLASVKACLSPPGRPIASLLFIGPTGVGKTEMARALAGYLFSDRRRMVRFDMSEFADPIAVERLVGGQGAGQGLLTGKVREQPFGVVLFDELEKADPAFFDLLLQILGEGRLTDESGRVADFTNSVIVMTSNLGATSFSKGPLGFRGEQESPELARRLFTSAVKAAFRPELFNRIDRLVPFAPLDRQAATAVARRELERMRSRDGLLSKNLVLEVDQDVAQYLARLGYDRRYGARPLKRAIERHLLEPLACIVANLADRKATVRVALSEGSLSWSVDSQQQPQRRTTTTAHSLAQRALELRRQSQAVMDSRQAQALRNQVHRLRKLAERKKRSLFMAEELVGQLGLLTAKEKITQRLKELGEAARALETEAVLCLQGFDPPDLELASKVSERELSLTGLMLDLFASNFDNPDRATAIVYSERGAEFYALMQGYFDFWQAGKITANCYKLNLGARGTEEQANDPILRLGYGDEADDRALWCEPIPFQDCLRADSLGVAIELEGPRVLPLMLGETGLHVFGTSSPRNIEVTVFASPLKTYAPPTDLHLRRNLAGLSKRRFYHAGQGTVDDPRLQRARAWNGKGLDKILAEFLPAELMRQAAEACS